MKHFLYILLFIGILFQTFSKVIIFINFEINQDYIAKNICVKKNIPNNHCNGKCHLNKLLKEDDNKQDTTPFANFKQIKEVQLFYQKKDIVLANILLYTEHTYSPYRHSEKIIPVFSCFHPPKS